MSNALVSVRPVSPEAMPCRVCAEPIKPAARICIHCNSYQDWRGYMGMSQSVLALLTALISVATVFIPIATDAFTPKVSNLAFSFQAVEAGRIVILVSNSGSRPGSIRGGRMNILDRSNPIASSISLVGLDVFSPGTLEDPSKLLAAKIVEPGKSELVILTASSVQEPSRYKSAKGNLVGSLNISLTNFHGVQGVTDNIVLDTVDLELFLGLRPTRF